MVQLRLTIKIPPRELLDVVLASPSYNENGKGEHDEGAKFLLVVPDPEKVNVGMLVNMVHAQWQKLRPGVPPLEIKKLLDDNYDAYDLDMDLYLSEVFVDSGKAKADGYDQRGTVRIVQNPTYHDQVRCDSVVQHRNRAAATSTSNEPQAAITGGPVTAPIDMEHGDASIEQPEYPRDEEFNNDSLIGGTAMEGSATVRYPSEVSDGREAPEEDIFQPAGDSFDSPQKSVSMGGSENSVRFADENYFDTAEYTGSEDAPKQTGTKNSDQGGRRVKPFRETEAEFRRSRASTVGPEPERLVDSPFKKLLAAERKRKQSKPPQSPPGKSASESLRVSKDHDNNSSSPAGYSPKSSFHVEIPVKVEEASSDSDGTVKKTTLTSRKRKGLISAEESGKTYEVPSSPSEASPGIRGNRRPAESQKTKESGSKEPSFATHHEPSQRREDSVKAYEKPVPPPRLGSSFSYPPNFSPEKIKELCNKTAKNFALDAARKDGAGKDHLKQIEIVHGLSARYHDAVEDGRSQKRVEKLRARWERANNTLKEKAAETAKTKAENFRHLELMNNSAQAPQTSTLRRASNGQPVKETEQGPATPKSKLRASILSASKISRSAEKKPDSARKLERPKVSETTESVKSNTSDRATAPSRTRFRSLIISSSESENNNDTESPDVVITSPPRKRQRRSKK